MSDNNLASGIKTGALPGGANEVSSSEQGRADALSLEYTKNNSHYDKKANCYVGHFRGVKKVSDYEYRGIQVNLTYKQVIVDYIFDYHHRTKDK